MISLSTKETEGYAWVMVDPRKVEHTHKIVCGVDVGIMTRLLTYKWKPTRYRRGYLWYIGTEPDIVMLLIKGDWNDNIKRS